MLHIKLEENGVRSTMQAHILSLHTPSVPGAESKVKTFFFLKVVIVHIELKEMTQATISQDPSPPPPHRDPGCGFKRKNSTFSEHGHFAYQINGITNAVTCKHIDCLHTPPQPMG